MCKFWERGEVAWSPTRRIVKGENVSTRKPCVSSGSSWGGEHPKKAAVGGIRPKEKEKVGGPPVVQKKPKFRSFRECVEATCKVSLCMEDGREGRGGEKPDVRTRRHGRG